MTRRSRTNRRPTESGAALLAQANHRRGNAHAPAQIAGSRSLEDSAKKQSVLVGVAAAVAHDGRPGAERHLGAGRAQGRGRRNRWCGWLRARSHGGEAEGQDGGGQDEGHDWHGEPPWCRRRGGGRWQRRRSRRRGPQGRSVNSASVPIRRRPPITDERPVCAADTRRPFRRLPLGARRVMDSNVL